ncbi:MAG: biotin carboxylase [candidate division Zixibacteria bacterium HGW-Zixibacteria-1]|nr:MAG: biotin carboxylase [candidate division Zixibacteria bacterium HGW-Zixibacteria-1]
MPAKRVLVVGTTSDYIEILSRRYPGRILFLTDHKERAGAFEPPPEAGSEVLCDLMHYDKTLTILRDFLIQHNFELSGVACFDDESMALTSFIAKTFSLPYPPASAVANGRSKFLSKQLWEEAGLPSPRMTLIHDLAEAITFLGQISGPIVIKPLTGSGSELTFACHSEDDCRKAFAQIREKLEKHSNIRMYLADGRSSQPDPHTVFVGEEFIEGREFSADFIVDGDKIKIIRIAGKIFSANNSFGTALGYILPMELPPAINKDAFSNQLLEAAHALGVERSFVMIDFIVRDGKAIMLEMAPRPGGDNLPFLIRQSSDFDILGATLDFAEGKQITIPGQEAWKRLIGARIIAAREGTISEMDTAPALRDMRVRECYLKRHLGHKVILPPDDYDSRILGHVIFAPTDWSNVESEIVELLEKVNIKQGQVSCLAIPTF